MHVSLSSLLKVFSVKRKIKENVKSKIKQSSSPGLRPSFAQVVRRGRMKRIKNSLNLKLGEHNLALCVFRIIGIV